MGIEEGRTPYKSIRFPAEDLEREFAKERGEDWCYLDERISYLDELNSLVFWRDFEGAYLLVKERERRETTEDIPLFKEAAS